MKYQKQIKALQRFVDTETVKYPNVGLCSNCDLPNWHVSDLTHVIRTWPYFSGSYYYIIPETSTQLPKLVGAVPAKEAAQQQYKRNRRVDTFYKGEQLYLRLSFAKHLIKELSALGD